MKNQIVETEIGKVLRARAETGPLGKDKLGTELQHFVLIVLISS